MVSVWANGLLRLFWRRVGHVLTYSIQAADIANITWLTSGHDWQRPRAGGGTLCHLVPSLQRPRMNHHSKCAHVASFLYSYISFFISRSLQIISSSCIILSSCRNICRCCLFITTLIIRFIKKNIKNVKR
jgi:hypothetical protein